MSWETDIEGITQISIESSNSAPTQSELSDFLNEGIKDLTNKIVFNNPPEAYKFAAESNTDASSGIPVSGKILSVVRENGNTTDLRPATPISPELRYLATDKTSIYYRSVYNPCYYILNRYIYVLPAPESNNRALVSQINYATTAYSQSAIGDFPDEYEDLVMKYAAAKACQAAASDIQNNMPTKPVAPASPVFEIDDIEVPELPVYNPPKYSISLGQAISSIKREDFDAAEKQLNIVEKRIEEYTKLHEQENIAYQKDLEVFSSEVDINTKNKDIEVQKITQEYRSEIYKYQYDIGQYGQELQESMTKYKWFIEQYIALMNEYNAGLSIVSPKPSRSSKNPKPKEVKPSNDEVMEQMQGGL